MNFGKLLTVRKGKRDKGYGKAKKRTYILGGYTYKYPFTIWEQIKDDIIALIIRGELNAGDKVPSLTEVAACYHCGRSTAQKALESLCETGILYMVQGKGFFVNKAEGLKEQLVDEYKRNMADILKRYIAMGKRIGMTDEEILEEVRKKLHINGI